MDKNLLTAVIGAVSTYIQQEEITRNPSEHRSNTRWLREHLDQARTRTNVRIVGPHLGMNLQRHYRLEKRWQPEPNRI